MTSHLPQGWSESRPGGMMTNPDPVNGGIIDSAFGSGEWFVIFNRNDLPTLEGFASRDEVFAAFESEWTKATEAL
jgi:putative DNA primase/helicase